MNFKEQGVSVDGNVQWKLVFALFAYIRNLITMIVSVFGIFTLHSILEYKYASKRVQIWHVITLFWARDRKNTLKNLDLGENDCRIINNLFSD